MNANMDPQRALAWLDSQTFSRRSKTDETPAAGACEGLESEIQRMCQAYCEQGNLCVDRCEGREVGGRRKVYGSCQRCSDAPINVGEKTESD